MESSQKEVAIVLATYHPQHDFFRTQIQSIKDQISQNWICIVSDDSTEPAEQVFVQDQILKDPRFIYIKNTKERGVYSNFENALLYLQQKIKEKGSSFSNVKYVALSDQDDRWLPNKIQISCDHLKMSGRSLLHSDLQLINASGEIFSESCWSYEKRDIQEPLTIFSLMRRNCVTGCSVLFDIHLLEYALPFPQQKTTYYLHDWWLASVAVVVGRGVYHEHQALIQYRQHGQNVVGAQTSKKMSFRKIFTMQLLFKLAAPFWERQSLAKDLLLKFSSSISEKDHRAIQVFESCQLISFFWNLLFLSSYSFDQIRSSWRLALSFFAAKIQKMFFRK